MIGAQLDDSSPDSVNEGDAGAVRMSANRALHVMLKDHAGNERGLNIDASGQVAVTIAAAQTVATVTTVTTLTGGGIAHDSADSGNPIKVGAKAIAALSGATLVAAADRADNQADLDGALITRADFALGDVVSGNASNTDGTSTQCLAAGASGIKHYLNDVILTNMSATDIYVEIKDGTTVKLTVPVPQKSGAIIALRTPIAGTAATAWNFDPSAAATTVYCSMSAFKSKI